MVDKLWSGRFAERSHPAAEAFTESVSFDYRLAPYDIAGSIVHARMLAECGIIESDEAERIVGGLEKLLGDVQAGTFEFRADLEDVHTNIEVALTELIGPVAGKLHTARSRNDQVALDLRMYLRDVIDDVRSGIRSLQSTLADLAEKHTETIMPGMTHLQHAQPVSLAHHMLAYFWMFERDAGRMADARRRVNSMPLGAAALAGTSFPIDRDFVARELGFDSVAENSIDAVSDRDFAIEFCSAAAIVMMHISRLAEEIVLWSSAEFGFVTVDETFATGSSIMPQKRNPDVAELARGKTGRVYGALVALLTLMKGLPLAYNRDMQEDKPPLFDAADTLLATLNITDKMMASVTVHTDRLAESTAVGAVCATDLADYLVRKGVPFRDAHRCVAALVKTGLETGRELNQLTIEGLREAHELFDDDALDCLSAESALHLRTSHGGTAPDTVRAQLECARKVLDAGGE